MITNEILPMLQGVIAAQIVTASADNVPNCTVVSQVYPVDERHIAVSNQFFSKTFRNLGENPYAYIQVLDPKDGRACHLEVVHRRTEFEGPLFDEMELQLAAIASMSGMSDVFKLKSAYVFEVLSVRLLSELQQPASTT